MPGLGGVIARTVRAERTARGWTQAQLAKELGLSGRAMSELETGKRRVMADDLLPLCRALGMTLPQLLARVDAEDRATLGV
jgi:transcriptional regulator with XRE-family HTH domain